MSLYRIALAVFLVATGLLFVFGFDYSTHFAEVTGVVAGIAAWVTAFLLVFHESNTVRN